MFFLKTQVFHKHVCFCKKYFVLYHDQGHDQGHDHDLDHDLDHDTEQSISYKNTHVYGILEFLGKTCKSYRSVKSHIWHFFEKK